MDEVHGGQHFSVKERKVGCRMLRGDQGSLELTLWIQ